MRKYKVLRKIKFDVMQKSDDESGISSIDSDVSNSICDDNQRKISCDYKNNLKRMVSQRGL